MSVAMVEKKTFNAASKLKVINYTSQYSNRGAARMCGIDQKRVHEWKTQKKTWRISGKEEAAGWGRLQSSITRHQRIADSVD